MISVEPTMTHPQEEADDENNKFLWFVCDCKRVFENHRQLITHKENVHRVRRPESLVMVVYSQSDLSPALCLPRVNVKLPRTPSPTHIKTSSSPAKALESEPSSSSIRSPTYRIRIQSSEQNGHGNLENIKSEIIFDFKKEVDSSTSISPVKLYDEEILRLLIPPELSSSIAEVKVEYKSELESYGIDTHEASMDHEQEHTAPIGNSKSEMNEKPDRSRKIREVKRLMTDREVILATHSTENIPCLSCTVCDRTFRREDYRLLHESSAHGINHPSIQNNQNSDEDDTDNSEDQSPSVILSELDEGKSVNVKIFGQFLKVVKPETSLEYTDLNKAKTLLVCNSCGKVCDDKFEFGTHILSSHMTELLEIEIKNAENDKVIPAYSSPDAKSVKIKCNYCDQSFDNVEPFKLHLLLEHIKAQSGENGKWNFISADVSGRKIVSTKQTLGRKYTTKYKFRITEKERNNVTAGVSGSPSPTYTHVKSESEFEYDYYMSSENESKNTKNNEPKIYKPRQEKFPYFVCNICNDALYKESKSLWIHMKSIHQADSEITICKICANASCSWKSLEKHYQNCHAHWVMLRPEEIAKIDRSRISSLEKVPITRRKIRDQKHKCEICGAAFLKDIELKEHMNRHNGVKPFICSYCGNSYHTSNSLSNHKKIHINEGRFVCETCGKKCNLAKNFRDHLATHAAGKEFKCDICGKGFKTYLTMRRHLSSHLSIEEKKKRMQFECEVCSKRLKTKAALKVHMAGHAGILTYSCDKCDKRFIQKMSLVKHSKVHTSLKYYPCSKCGRKFQTQLGLDGHEPVHGDEKLWPCNECDKKFTIKKYLDCHKKYTHMREVERRYTCETCGSRFKMLNHLRQHETIHTGIPWKYARKSTVKRNEDYENEQEEMDMTSDDAESDDREVSESGGQNAKVKKSSRTTRSTARK